MTKKQKSVNSYLIVKSMKNQLRSYNNRSSNTQTIKNKQT